MESSSRIVKIASRFGEDDLSLVVCIFWRKREAFSFSRALCKRRRRLFGCCQKCWQWRRHFFGRKFLALCQQGGWWWCYVRGRETSIHGCMMRQFMTIIRSRCPRCCLRRRRPLPQGRRPDYCLTLFAGGDGRSWLNFTLRCLSAKNGNFNVGNTGKDGGIRANGHPIMSSDGLIVLQKLHYFPQCNPAQTSNLPQFWWTCSAWWSGCCWFQPWN